MKICVIGLIDKEKSLSLENRCKHLGIKLVCFNEARDVFKANFKNYNLVIVTRLCKHKLINTINKQNDNLTIARKPNVDTVFEIINNFCRKERVNSDYH